jgi:Matrixin
VKRKKQRPPVLIPEPPKVRKREKFVLILLLPVIGFIGWQVWQQRMEDEQQRTAEALASAPIEDAPLPTHTRAPAAASPYGAQSAQVVSTGTSDTPGPDASGRDVQDIRHRLQLGERGTYIGEILLVRDSGLARWPERVINPLRVWVATGRQLPGWNEHYPDRVREAFDIWSLAGVPVKFTFVRDSSDADVIVEWVDRFDSPITGRTLWSRDRNWWIVNGSITLALHHTGGEMLDEPSIHAIALHEVGHLLGLDHSADTTNIMTARVRVHDLTSADRATIRLLYSLPPGSIK